jgi:hypothetical protein
MYVYSQREREREREREEEEREREQEERKASIGGRAECTRRLTGLGHVGRIVIAARLQCLGHDLREKNHVIAGANCALISSGVPSCACRNLASRAREFIVFITSYTP